MLQGKDHSGQAWWTQDSKPQKQSMLPDLIAIAQLFTTHLMLSQWESSLYFSSKMPLNLSNHRSGPLPQAYLRGFHHLDAFEAEINEACVDTG